MQRDIISCVTGTRLRVYSQIEHHSIFPNYSTDGVNNYRCVEYKDVILCIVSHQNCPMYDM